MRFEELLEQNILALQEVKRLDEVGQKDNKKYYPYHRLISHCIEGYFILKGKIQDLIDSGRISFLDDLSKAHVHQVSIKEDMLE